MPTELTTTSDHAVEGSTFAIDAVFTDEEDVALTPDTLTYSLSDVNGNIINELEDVEVSDPSSSETIVLSGDDLGIPSWERLNASESYVLRVLTIEGTYSGDLGDNKPFRDQLTFAIDITAVDHDGV
jgi:hypothetical protein